MKQLFFKPFEKYSETSLIIAGLIAGILASILAFYTSLRFDGVFDIHIYEETTIAKNLLDNAINVFSIFIWFSIAAKITYIKTRFIDILALALFSRIPLYFAILGNINHTLSKASENLKNTLEPNFKGLESTDIAIMVVFAFLVIMLAIWFVMLLYNGFKVSTNAKGTKPVLLFIVALILSEISSKILINLINS